MLNGIVKKKIKLIKKGGEKIIFFLKYFFLKERVGVGGVRVFVGF